MNQGRAGCLGGAEDHKSRAKDHHCRANRPGRAEDHHSGADRTEDHQSRRQPQRNSEPSRNRESRQNRREWNKEHSEVKNGLCGHNREAEISQTASKTVIGQAESSQIASFDWTGH